jgi:prephenate dehydrogenase
MWADICLANKEQLVKLMGDYQRLNERVVKCIENDDKEGLLKLFESAHITRNNFINQ